MPKTATPTPSALDLVNQMAGAAKTPAKKPSKPTLRDPQLDQAIDQFIAAKQQEETAHALKLAAEDQLMEAARPFRLEASEQAGQVVASISVNGRITATQQCRYSAIPEDAAGELEAAFGDDADRFFDTTLKIGLNRESANDEAVLRVLVERLGPEFFQQHFEVSRDRLVRPAFHAAYSTDPAVRKTAAPFVEGAVIRPAKMSFRVS